MGKHLKRDVRREMKRALADAYHAGAVQTWRDVWGVVQGWEHEIGRRLSVEQQKHLLHEVRHAPTDTSAPACETHQGAGGTVNETLSHSHDGLASGLNIPAPTLFKAAVFDIETTDFSATGYKGFLVCCSILPLEAPHPYTITLDFDDHNDSEALMRVLDELARYDLLIGHYISGYDLPWLDTRRQQYGLPGLRTWLIYDTYYEAKRQRIRSERKSLAFLIDHFGLEGTKTAIYPRYWNNIRSKDYGEFSEARDAIVEHCEFDVLANRNVFWKLLPKSWALMGTPFKMTNWRSEPDYSHMGAAA